MLKLLGLLVMGFALLACGGGASAPPATYDETTLFQPSPDAGGNDNPMTGVTDDFRDETNPGGRKAQGWSASGTLICGQASKSVSVQKPFDEEAGVYTVQFSVNPAIDTGGFVARSRPQAIVSWSVEGGTVSRRFDVGNGTTISGVGQAVKASLSDQTDPAFNPAPIAYGVSIQVSPGVRPTTGQPPSLIYTEPGGLGPGFTINHGVDKVFDVPLDAGVISVMVNYGPVALNTAVEENVIEIIEQDAAGNTNKIYYASADGPAFVPMSPLTTAIAVNNSSTGTNYNVTVTFGIDG